VLDLGGETLSWDLERHTVGLGDVLEQEVAPA
jgi:hypothetical protein